MEIDNLAAECEQSPARLRKYLVELVRSRQVIRTVRQHHGRLPQRVEQSLILNLPPHSTAQEWAKLAGVEGAPDLVAEGDPVSLDLDLDLRT